MDSEVKNSTKLLAVSEILEAKPVKKKPPRAGMGRPKGVPNKVNRQLKDMILGALSDVGGQEYLVKQAEENPTAFLGLIAKVLPTELKSADPGGLIVTVQTGVPAERDGE